MSRTFSCGVTQFRNMRIKDFRELQDTLLIEEFLGKPIAAVLPYKQYLNMQTVIIKAEEALAKMTPELPGKS